MIPNKIHAYAGIFYTKMPMEIDEARYYIICSSKIALDTFNHDENIQGFLENIPFTKNNIFMFIYADRSLKNVDWSNVVACVCNVYGDIRYQHFDPLTKRLDTFYSETYEEALQKLQDSNKAIWN